MTRSEHPHVPDEARADPRDEAYVDNPGRWEVATEPAAVDSPGPGGMARPAGLDSLLGYVADQLAQEPVIVDDPPSGLDSAGSARLRDDVSDWWASTEADRLSAESPVAEVLRDQFPTATMADHWIERALDADEAPPILFAKQAVVDEWVLVPRRHLRTIQGWNGVIEEVDAIMMCASVLADARLLGQARTCRTCGCTDDAACPGGCRWVDLDLCSSCFDQQLGGVG